MICCIVLDDDNDKDEGFEEEERDRQFQGIIENLYVIFKVIKHHNVIYFEPCCFDSIIPEWSLLKKYIHINILFIFIFGLIYIK